MRNQSKYETRQHKAPLSSTLTLASVDGLSQTADLSDSAGSRVAREALTAISTIQLPSNLSSQMMEAVHKVCHDGLSRSLAAYQRGVSPVTLGAVMSLYGLKRGPPENVRKALDLIAKGMARGKAERLSDTTAGRVKYWIDRLMAKEGRTGAVADVVRDAVANNLTPMEAALKGGVCYGSVIRTALLMGVKLRRPSRYKVTERDQDILAKRRAGMKLREIGVEYGITPERVRQIVLDKEKK